MAVKSKTQLAADIAASTFTAPQQVILDDIVDSYQDLSQPLTTVQIAAIATPASGQLVYNTDLSQFQYYNGSIWVGLGTLLEKQVVISAAELATLFTTPVTLIPAAGSGLAINIISYTRKTSFGTVAYDFASPLGICASSNTVANSMLDIDEMQVNAVATCSGSKSDLNESNTVELIKANEAIQLKATANPTQGDGTLTLWITYNVIAY